MSHINPLTLKPNKVGISPENAYAYAPFGSLIQTIGALGLQARSLDLE